MEMELSCPVKKNKKQSTLKLDFLTLIMYFLSNLNNITIIINAKKYLINRNVFFAAFFDKYFVNEFLFFREIIVTTEAILSIFK